MKRFGIALLMAAVVWWLLKQSINVRPWASDPAPGSVRDDGVRSPFTLAPLPSVKLGKYVRFRSPELQCNLSVWKRLILATWP